MNDLDSVRRVLSVLDSAGARCWLFGGWAEELRGLRAPGPHADIDLLYPADSFAAVQGLLASPTVEEIEAKRFVHKRAFVLDGVMTELFLVCGGRDVQHTLFWGEVRYDWPRDTFTSPASFDWPVAGAAALIRYREAHPRPARRWATECRL